MEGITFLSVIFCQVKPAMRLNVPSFKSITRFAPFSLKLLLFPYLKIDDTALRSLGWSPTRTLAETLEPIICREKSRSDVTRPLHSGQTVVTGAGSGLGKAFVEHLASIRENILMIDINRNALEELSMRFENCSFVVCDLGNEKAQDDLMKSEQWNRLPVLELFSCAGYGRRGFFVEDTVEQQLDMLKVNLLSRVWLSHRVLPDMKKKSIWSDRLGVLIISISALARYDQLFVIKCWVAFFGEGLSYEVKGNGIRVLTVCPGGMQTNFQQSAGVKEVENEKLMLPKEVVEEVMLKISGSNPVVSVPLRSKDGTCGAVHAEKVKPTPLGMVDEKKQDRIRGLLKNEVLSYL